jgi:hypothetical protein
MSAAIFVLLLLCFAVRYGYYLPAKLVLVGTAAPGSSFEIHWDSGSGFNNYEKSIVTISDPTQDVPGLQGQVTFRKELGLPQTRLLKLRITQATGPSTIILESLAVTSARGSVVVPVSYPQFAGELVVDPFNPNTRTFHGGLLLVQGLFALFGG